jgi:tetratricopeptide (TPR) repeat protein
MSYQLLRRCFFIIAMALMVQGCVGLALQTTPSLIPNLSQAVFEECDMELARASMPADLKLMEGLLKSAPQNTQLLTALSMGFTGYGLLFLEDVDPERASKLYLRAKAYAMEALGDAGKRLQEATLNLEQARIILQNVGRDAVEPLFWATLAWNGWVNLNLDNPSALAQMGVAQACIERLLEIEPSYLYGTAHVLMGTILAAKPTILGGDAAAAKAHFDKAMEISKGTFLLTPYYYARYYAVKAQDKKLFSRLLDEAVAQPAEELRDVCLLNTIMKEKAGALLGRMDEFFY